MKALSLKSLLLQACLAFSSGWLWANEPVPQTSHKPFPPVSSISISGIERTEKDVVERELLMRSGDPADPELFKKSLQRLRNLQIFSEVSGRYLPKKDNSSVDLEINIKEAFSVIPIVNFGGDAGTNYFGLGVIDLNALGRYLEIGAIYVNYGGRDSGLAWYRDRRFGGKRRKFGIDLDKDVKTRRLFDDEGEVSGGYTKDITAAKVLLEEEVTGWFRVGGALERREIAVNQKGITGELEDISEKNNFEISTDIRQWITSANIIVGRINRDRERMFGSETELEIGTSSLFNGDDYHTEFRAEHKTFLKLPYRSNFGVRGKFEMTDSGRFENAINVGGIEAVRGYRDGRFFGKRLIYGSAEYRIPSIVSKNLILQHVAFFDTGRLVERIETVFNDRDEFFSSAGTGLRFIWPKLYVLAARIDVAFTFDDREESSVAFGLQQFF